MHGHEFLATYPAKLMEYSLAVGYLLLFIPFWRYVQGGKAAARAVAPARHAGATAPVASSWFTVPEGVQLHPGHTWARARADGLVEVGLDDFASRLLGPVERVMLPVPGALVSQGLAAVQVEDGGRVVELVSPVDGLVAEVNPEAGSGWLQEPYGAGWLFRVRPARLGTNQRQLFSGLAARRWLEQAAESLSARLSPQLGQVLQDGGTPVHGLARELDPERWDALCREYFRS
jgi:glycine cleavage system H lipoate-binding protein